MEQQRIRFVTLGNEKMDLFHLEAVPLCCRRKLRSGCGTLISSASNVYPSPLPPSRI